MMPIAEIIDRNKVKSVTSRVPPEGAPAAADKPVDVSRSDLAAITADSLIIDRLIARIPMRRRWVVLAIGLILLLIPLAFALIDAVPPMTVLQRYRAPFIYALAVVYMLVVFDALQKTRAGVALGLRPLISTDKAGYISLVREGCRVRPTGELVALGTGLALSLSINLMEPFQPGPYALERYAYLSRIVVLSLDAWFIYVVFAMTRLTNTLLKQPIDVDLFHLAPFEPIGHQSVWLCLTFVGSMLLGLLTFDAFNWSLLQEAMAFYALVLIFIAAVFYVNTRRVHGIITAEKKRRLNALDSHLARAADQLEKSMASHRSGLATATEINALAVIKQELKLTRTWPYNTEMVRALFISILTPLAVSLMRAAVVLFAG